jgi:hypothetical protein
MRRTLEENPVRMTRAIEASFPVDRADGWVCVVARTAERIRLAKVLLAR